MTPEHNNQPPQVPEEVRDQLDQERATGEGMPESPGNVFDVIEVDTLPTVIQLDTDHVDPQTCG